MIMSLLNIKHSIHGNASKPRIMIFDQNEMFTEIYFYTILYKVSIACTIIGTRCTRGVRVVFSVTKMRSSNSARINKFDFSTEKIVQCTHDNVGNCCSSQCCQLDTFIDMMYVEKSVKTVRTNIFAKNCMLP